MADQGFARVVDGVNEGEVTVVGRRSGRALSRPVWFVRDGRSLYLVPIYGTDSNWYKNAVKTPAVRISAGGVELDADATPITDAEQVAHIVDRFRQKYGNANFERLYPKPVAALAIAID